MIQNKQSILNILIYLMAVVHKAALIQTSVFFSGFSGLGSRLTRDGSRSSFGGPADPSKSSSVCRVPAGEGDGDVDAHEDRADGCHVAAPRRPGVVGLRLRLRGRRGRGRLGRAEMGFLSPRAELTILILSTETRLV